LRREDRDCYESNGYEKDSHRLKPDCLRCNNLLQLQLKARPALQQDMGSGVYESGILCGYGNDRMPQSIRVLQSYRGEIVIAVTAPRSHVWPTHKSGLECLPNHRLQTRSLADRQRCI